MTDMLEAANNISVPLIAVILVVQAVVFGIGKWHEIKGATEQPQPSKSGNGTRAVMAHQITEIDQRTEEMVVAVRTLTPTVRELSESVRQNTRAVEKLTERINDTRP